MEIIKGQLYRSKISELVVMADEDINKKLFSGTAIKKSKSCEVGQYCDSWDKNLFQPYDAEIIIKEVIDFSKVQFVEMNDGSIILVNRFSTEEYFWGLSIYDRVFNNFKKEDVKKVVTPNFT
jgi:hypothetical protein